MIEILVEKELDDDGDIGEEREREIKVERERRKDKRDNKGDN